MPLNEIGNKYSANSFSTIRSALDGKIQQINHEITITKTYKQILEINNWSTRTTAEFRNLIENAIIFIEQVLNTLKEVSSLFSHQPTQRDAEQLLLVARQSQSVQSELKKLWKIHFEPPSSKPDLIEGHFKRFYAGLQRCLQTLEDLPYMYSRIAEIFHFQETNNTAEISVDNQKATQKNTNNKAAHAHPTVSTEQKAVAKKKGNNSTYFDMNPWKLIVEATKSVPSLKYGIAVAGIAALAAVIKSFNIDFTTAVISVVIILVFMVVLFIFVNVTRNKADLSGTVKFFTWASLILVMLTAYCLFSSVFFGIPLDMRYALVKQTKDTTTTKLIIADSGQIQPDIKPAKVEEFNFFLQAFANIDSLTKSDYIEESKLKDELINLFNYSPFSVQLTESENWGDLLYALSAISKKIQQTRSYFKRTPSLKTAFGKLDEKVTNLRNQIGYNVFSQSLSIFDHWDRYKNNESEFIRNLPTRKEVSPAMLTKLNGLRKQIFLHVDQIKNI